MFTFVLVVGVCLAPLGVAAAWFYFHDLRLHRGVGWLRRRRVARRGVLATARILSENGEFCGSVVRSAYSIVYEVQPEGVTPFRTRGVEVMWMAEAAANGVQTGRTVHVRFDPGDRTVVLVRLDWKRHNRDLTAAQKAREEELLRGGSRGMG